jgi:hypothetical protein
MASVLREETEKRRRIHQFAVQFHKTLVERYGVDHEQTKLASRLVEATNPHGGRTASTPSDTLARK